MSSALADGFTPRVSYGVAMMGAAIGGLLLRRSTLDPPPAMGPAAGGTLDRWRLPGASACGDGRRNENQFHPHVHPFIARSGAANAVAAGIVAQGKVAGANRRIGRSIQVADSERDRAG